MRKMLRWAVFCSFFVLAVLFSGILAQTPVERICNFRGAGDGCIFDLVATSSGTLTVATRAAVNGEGWRVTVVEVGERQARTDVGDGNIVSFSGVVSRHIQAGASYEVYVTYQLTTSPQTFPTSVAVRFTGPVEISGPRNAPVVPRGTVYVSLAGSDANPGTQALPLLSIDRAVAAAASQNADVHVAAGIYELPNTLNLISGVSIIGGFDPLTWEQQDSLETWIFGHQATGIRADNIQLATVLERLTISGAENVLTGGSSYGIFASGSGALMIRACKVIAGAGGSGTAGRDGSPGMSGTNGLSGQPGCEYSTTFGCSECPRPVPGEGGTGAGYGLNGGRGGAPGVGSDAGLAGQNSPMGTPGGAGGTESLPGNTGNNAYNAENGGNGPPGAFQFQPTGYLPSRGGDGSDGRDGAGGGGGGGGGGGTYFCDDYGGAGGGGGAGGVGGSGGTGGSSGGGSFAIYLWNTSVTIENSILQTAQGGQGGSGGNGGSGGIGGAGGPGGAGSDGSGAGGWGGRGGNGGNGGFGGGGAGGPSIGILVGGSSIPVLSGNSFIPGGPGLGGSSNGRPGPEGIVAETYTPASGLGLLSKMSLRRRDK